MYNYKWDESTGGYILTTSLGGVIKEVRPVFKEELRLLGFDKKFGWVIPETDAPIMWAEGRRYIYNGQPVAEVSGGSIYADPIIKELKHIEALIPVDVASMLTKNSAILEGLAQQTKKFIYKTFKSYVDKKVDMVYVAFSGGKDSIVLLDLVQKALPHDAFHVLFADTTMEMQTTYRAIEIAKNRWSDLNWHTAKADFDSFSSWKKIGPPAEKLRWCCSVHKTAPQVILIKNILKANKFKTLVFVGMRAEESEARSNYDTISESKKHIMQTSCCPILDWNTSELFLYMLQNDLFINNAYKLGLTRAGCIFCPMSSKWSFMLNAKIEPERVKKYVDTICEITNIEFDTQGEKENYYNERNWKLRLNGRDLKTGVNKLTEKSTIDQTIISVDDISDDWKKWIATIGTFYQTGDDDYSIEYSGYTLSFKTEYRTNGIDFKFTTPPRNKSTIRLMYLLKNVFYKSSYCVNCRVCEVECPVGAIHMVDGKLEIKGCIHCEHCMDRTKGCIVAQSLSIPRGNGMDKKGIAVYETRGFRKDWLEMLFDIELAGSNFWNNEQLGPNMFKSMKKWLEHSGMLLDVPYGDLKLAKDSSLSIIGKELARLGSDNLLTWAIIYTNLAYNSALINWYITAVQIGIECDNTTLDILLGDKYTTSIKGSAIKSLKETMKASPIGWGLGQGDCFTKGNTVQTITKKTWSSPDSLAILYAMYKYAEASGLYDLTITDLYVHSLDQNGISPTALFGLDREILMRILLSLSHDFPQYIQVAFNKDLENINLNREKTSLDVIKLA